MAVPDFFRTLAFGLHPRFRCHLKNVEPPFADGGVDTFPFARNKRTGDVHSQQPVFMKKGNADLVGLKLSGRAVEHVHGEKPFVLGLVDDRALIELFEDAPQFFRRLIALQAHFALVSPIGVLVGNVVLAVVIGEAMQTVGNYEFGRYLLPLEHHFVT